jgi:6-phospho-beta-glucosidase
LARIKLAYIGGGSTRAPGTMASLIHQGENFDGSEVLLVDLKGNEDRLQVVKTISEKLIAHKGLDIQVTTTTDRRTALQDCDAVLTSYRPGGFEARYLDESIPLKHGIIGQETQGPGGFFMAMRSIAVIQGIIADMEAACPDAILFNYTNPVNIVSEAVSHHTDIPVISFCEGPIYFPRDVVAFAGLDPDKLDSIMVGVNHNSWTVRHDYEGQNVIPLLQAAYERKLKEGAPDDWGMRLLHIASVMETIPAAYYVYYYFKNEILAELQAKPTTRSQDIMASVPDYWQHYREQAEADVPELNPNRSRGGIHELELALDAMDAIFNDKDEVMPVNVPNKGALPDFPSDRVVEVPALLTRHGADPIACDPLPASVVGLTQMLAEYQALTAEAAWTGTRQQAVQALASNPLVLSLSKAEALYDDMANALRDYLPERLLH